MIELRYTPAEDKEEDMQVRLWISDNGDDGAPLKLGLTGLQENEVSQYIESIRISSDVKLSEIVIDDDTTIESVIVHSFTTDATELNYAEVFEEKVPLVFLLDSLTVKENGISPAIIDMVIDLCSCGQTKYYIPANLLNAEKPDVTIFNVIDYITKAYVI